MIAKSIRWWSTVVVALLLASACTSSPRAAVDVVDEAVGDTGDNSSGPPAGPDRTVRSLPPDRSRPCVSLELNSSIEKDDLMAQLARRYNEVGATPDGRCVEISVHGVTSGLAMTSLRDGWDEQVLGAPEPQAWSPTWSMWASLLHLDNPQRVDAGPWESVAQSPLTIAMPKPMAEAMGWPERELGWADVLNLSNDPAGWAALGHPEWGRFAIGKDNPTRSTSGMAATVASYYAATGRTEGITLEDLDRPEVRRFVSDLEQGVARYADESTKFLSQMAEADRQGETVPYVSAILLQEQLVHLYNRGNPTGDWDRRDRGSAPTVPLVAVHAADGTLMMDHPIVVFPWATADQRQVAEGFRAFVQEPEQQADLAEWGFRGADGRAGEALAETIGVAVGEVPPVVTPPSPEVANAILDDWTDLRKRARLLLLFDVSGSMLRTVPDGRTRLDAAKEAASAALDQLHPEDQVGLWAFASAPWSTGASGPESPPFRVALPPGGLEANRATLVESINGLAVHASEDDTALYHTLGEAVEAMRTDFDPERINTIVVLSDGDNDWPSAEAAGRTAEQQYAEMLTIIGPTNPGLPIGVFAIAYGGEADATTLAEIAKVTRGETFDAQDPSTINDVFVKALSNF